MRRREFFRVFSGAAAAWPSAVRAQQASVPIVALISSGRLPESLIGIFRQGLAEQGYAEGRNVVIDYRLAIVNTSAWRASLPSSCADRLPSSLR
jgi:putative ABC transport system substrate-binding protein